MTTITTGISLFDFVPGLPVEELHKEMDVANAGGALLKRKMARCLCDMQVRGVYALTGHGSAVHYATVKYGMDRRRAHELVQIGRQLEDLPEIDAALVAGELSWSKMRIILRVAVPDTQSAWLAHADDTNCQRLSVDASRCLRGDLPKKNNRGGLTDIRMDVRASMDPHQPSTVGERQAKALSGRGCSRDERGLDDLGGAVDSQYGRGWCNRRADEGQALAIPADRSPGEAFAGNGAHSCAHRPRRGRATC